MIAVRLTGDDTQAWFELIKLGPVHGLPGGIYLISQKQLETLERHPCSFEKVELEKAGRIIEENTHLLQKG